MQDRMKREINRSHNNHSEDSPAMDVAAFSPRMWIIMIACAVPFLIISFNFFEALERTGTMGAIIADMLMPATTIAYVVLLFVLKSRKI